MKSTASVTTPVANADPAPVRTLHWIRRLRWTAVAGQAGTVAYVHWGLGVALPLVPVFGVIGLTALTNVVLHRFPEGRGESPASIAVVLSADVVLLTALGPALRLSPGFFDSVERKLRVDLSVVERLHGLELLTVLFVAFVAAAFLFWVTGRRRRVIALLLCGGLTAAATHRPTPARAIPLRQPNVLVIAADSWRFDRLGVHGASRPGLTPNLDAFAATALDLRNHHVSTASTLESWTTVLTGQFPPRHGLRSMYPSREEVAAVEQAQERLKKITKDPYYIKIGLDSAITEKTTKQLDLLEQKRSKHLTSRALSMWRNRVSATVFQMSCEAAAWASARV
jgi:hypothetical protein